jgi:hypothetical protein
MQDFDKVWPIFDSAQSREFRKVRCSSSFEFLFFSFSVVIGFSGGLTLVGFLLWSFAFRSSKALSASLSSRARCPGATPGSRHLPRAAGRG